jgi:hypothetical protein
MLAAARSRDVLVVTILGIATMGCGKAAGPKTGTGGVANQGGATATGGSGQGGTASGGTTSVGGQTGAGGITGFGGRDGTGGSLGVGGWSSTGGIVASGGTVGTGGRTGAGGTSATGGTVSRDGGLPDVPGGTGGAGAGGTIGAGGATGGTAGTTVGRGGSSGTGGVGTGGVASGGSSRTGGVASGGSSGTGGVATGGSTGTSTVTIDCNAAMPSNGELHSGNTQGTVGNQAWSLWSNGGGVTMTTFDTPAFRATWGPNSGDVLARFGLSFGSDGLTYDQYGPITAQFAEIKSGTGGGYSYIGVHGYSTDPCAEFYIVDDAYVEMPIKPYSTSTKGTVTIDGAAYDLYSGSMTSAGDSSCRGVPWRLFYSVRQTARTCGQISITQHFDAWKAAGMILGSLLEVQVYAEVGGGTGSIDFPVANVTIGP